MKAVVMREFGDPSVMKIEELAEPKPGPGQVLVEVKAAGVNPVEAYIRSGSYPRRPELPAVPGGDGAGVVKAVGEGVKGFEAGQRVYFKGVAPGLHGAYAQAALCQERQVHPLPDTASFEQGAALGVPYGTAYQALFHRALARPGESVLVHGASGGVGVAAVQLARRAGLTVFGTAGTEKGRVMVKEQGAHHVLDHGDPAHLDRLMELTGGAGVDVVVEMLANLNLGADLKALAMGGRVVVVGSRGSVEIDPRAAMSREAAILGMTLFAATPRDESAIHAALLEGLKDGTLKPVVGRRFGLAEAPAAHGEIMKPGSFGKIVLIP